MSSWLIKNILLRNTDTYALIVIYHTVTIIPIDPVCFVSALSRTHGWFPTRLCISAFSYMYVGLFSASVLTRTDRDTWPAHTRSSPCCAFHLHSTQPDIRLASADAQHTQTWERTGFLILNLRQWKVVGLCKMTCDFQSSHLEREALAALLFFCLAAGSRSSLQVVRYCRLTMC